MLGGNRVAILVEEGFEDSELTEPMRALKEAGAKVVLVGSGSSRSYTGKRNKTTIKPNVKAAEISAAEFDAIIIPGGHAPDRMRLYQPMIDLVQQAHDSGVILAAICHGPQLLISADVVGGHRVTSWPSIAVDLRNAGAEWIDAPVVLDGSLITSRKPADIPRFNSAIIHAMRDRYASEVGE